MLSMLDIIISHFDYNIPFKTQMSKKLSVTYQIP